MKRLLVMLFVLLAALEGFAQTPNSLKASNLYGDLSTTAGVKIVLINDTYLYYGTAGPFRERYNSSTGKLDLTDAAGNVMTQVTDAGTSGTFTSTGNMAVNGGTLTVGVGKAGTNWTSNGSAASYRLFQFQSNGSSRWQTGVNNTAESGANAGSDYILWAYDDAGTLIGGVYTITRAAGGAFTLARPLTLSGSNSITVGGDVAVNGGDITSTASTMNVFNTTSTTVNAFGKATALTLGETGASAGTTTIRNRLATSNIITFTANDTTPSVAHANIFKVPNTWTAGNNITAFDDGTAGQTIRVIGGDSDCVFADGGTLVLAGDWTAAANATLSLVFDGSNWYETSRSAN